MDSPLALTSGVKLAAAVLLDHSFGAGAGAGVGGGGGGGGRRLDVRGGGGGGGGESGRHNILSGVSSNHAAAGSGAAGTLLFNATMKLESDLATVCSNLTGIVVGGGGGGGRGVDGGGMAGGGGACDTKAMGISLSTPILMMSTGVLGNLLALLVLLTTDRKVRRAPFFPLLMAMACTDLVGQVATGVIAIITYANDLKWVGGRPMCIYHGFMMVFLAVVTPLLVCSMSVERLLALKFSYFYQRCFTNRLAKGIIVGSLAFTLFFSTWPLMGFGSYELQFPGSWCFLNYHRESLSDMIFALVFAGLNIVIIAFIILSNGIVVWTLLKMRRVRHQLRSSPSVEGTMSVIKKKPKSRSSALHLEMETQMVWFLLAITIIFSCLWLPINVHIVINQITGETNYKQDLITVRLASINQIIDPWMYIIFRKATFFKFLRRIKRLISRGKASCGVYSETDKPTSNRLSLTRRLPGRQSGPSAISNGTFRAKDQALDLLLPSPGCDHSGYHNNHGVMDVSPSDREIEMYLNGPLHIIEGAAVGCGDPSGPLRAIKEVNQDDLEVACRAGAERDTSLSKSGDGQGQLCLTTMTFCEDECSKDRRRESILHEEEEKNLPEQQEAVLRKNSRGHRGSTSSSSSQKDKGRCSQEVTNRDSRRTDSRKASSYGQLVVSTTTEKTPSQEEGNSGSRRDVEASAGVTTSTISQNERRQQRETNDNTCARKARENPADTLGRGEDDGVEQFREAGQGRSRGTVDEEDCTSQHSHSEDRSFREAWERNAQTCFYGGVSRNDDTTVVNGKQLKSSPQNVHVISIPNDDLNSNDPKKLHLWK